MKPDDKKLEQKRASLKRTARGDEWAEYTYKGRKLFDTSCGTAGVYEDGTWRARTIDEYLEKFG